MERVEDRSKALSYIGIEIADALKLIPVPAQDNKPAVIEKKEQKVGYAETASPIQNASVNVPNGQQVQANQEQSPAVQEQKPRVQLFQRAPKFPANSIVVDDGKTAPDKVYENYYAETRREVKESLWFKFTHSKFVRAIKYALRIKVVLQLPEGMSEDNIK